MPPGINEQAFIDAALDRMDKAIQEIHEDSEYIDGASEETKALITNLVNFQG